MSRIQPSPWLHRFAVLTALATLALLAVGGLVTSHGAGMAVPDWPNTYGYNMFLFPVSNWVGGVLYEHSHRLVAAAVGLLTAVLAAWLWGRETRGSARWLGVGAMLLAVGLLGVRQMPVYVTLAAGGLVVTFGGLALFWRRPAELRWLGMVALAAVILQGVLGGLRVVWLKDEIGIFHGTLAQAFFVLTCAIALLTSRRWLAFCENAPQAPLPKGLRKALLVLTVVILGQLALGASMRHQHAGLAIPDFPLAHGAIWPDTSAAAIGRYNLQRVETAAFNPITAGQIWLQMAHRLVAYGLFAGIGTFAWRAWRTLGRTHLVARMAVAWFGLVCVQAGLGAWTIWSNKAADVATLHVLVGAGVLVTGAVMTMTAFRMAGCRRSEIRSPKSETNPKPEVRNAESEKGRREALGAGNGEIVCVPSASFASSALSLRAATNFEFRTPVFSQPAAPDRA